MGGRKSRREVSRSGSRKKQRRTSKKHRKPMTKKCPKCGKTLGIRARFCSRCRARLKSPELGIRRHEKGAEKKAIKVKDGDSAFVYKNIDGEQLFLETSIDDLLHLVEKRGKLKVSDAARRFKLPKDKIEEWGKILEGKKLMRMHYPPFGEPVLMVMSDEERKKKRKEKS